MPRSCCSSWDSPVIKQLLADARVELASFPHTDAYVALYPYLNKVIVPAGLGDLAKNRPATDVALFAPKASLVVRKDLHSAIQYLLLTTAVQIHSGPGSVPARRPVSRRRMDRHSDERRTRCNSTNPAARSCRTTCRSGWPRWSAGSSSCSSRSWACSIPCCGSFRPCTAGSCGRRFRDSTANCGFWRTRSPACDAEDRRKHLAGQLDLLEEQANHLKVSAGFANMLYMLRNHIALVRERLAALELERVSLRLNWYPCPLVPAKAGTQGRHAENSVQAAPGFPAKGRSRPSATGYARE